jgi:phospholipid transport system substrate-binding protein
VLKKKYFLIIIALIIFAINPLYAIEKANITPVMGQKIKIATTILQQKDLNATTKADKVFSLLDDVFDYQLMARLSLGKETWSKINAGEKKEFIDKFVKYLKHSYIAKLNLYTDEKLTIVGAKEINAQRIWLVTELIGAQDTYEITYKFYKAKNNDWLIYDVDIIGVSLIQTYIAQFSDILKEKPFSALLHKLEIKSK